MLELRRVHEIDDPVLGPYRTMKMQADHLQRRIFVAEGEKVVRRLFESGLEIHSVCLPEKWVEEFSRMAIERGRTVRGYVVEKEELEKLTGFSMYQGVMAVATIPPPVSLETVLQASVAPRFFAAIDSLSNSENIGVLVRNACAFGAQALLVGETASHPYLRRAVRSSMGTIFKLPVVLCGSLAESIGVLRERGVRSIAAHPHDPEMTLFDCDMRGDCCVVLGSEGLGISAAVLEACDEKVGIPMAAGVDSLNVGSAAAAFFLEVNRQRVRV